MRYRGTIKHWNAKKNFGFLRRDDGQEDVFVGGRQVPENAKAVGSVVEFSIGADQKTGKPCAINANLVDARPAAGGSPIRFGVDRWND